MNAEPICPSCQKPLPAGAPKGLCPECLIKAGFGSGIAPGLGQPSRVPRFVALPVAEMAALFPQFEILELLGQGGMGAVYKARQPALDRLVAIKILPPQSSSDPGFADRFTREARTLAKLSHPNIVAVYDFGQAGSLPYFVMEYVEGQTLRQLEQACKLAPRDALKIIPQVCDALQFAHDEGVIHRDIKPENVMLDKKGRVKIADFGLAKVIGIEPEDSRLTGLRDIMGTAHYMAPEQAEHPQDVDHRADIYSLGVVFYEMLTGELPLGKFQAPSRKVRVDVRLDDVVLRSLEKEPELRYQQASQVKTDIQNIASTPPQSAPALAASVAAPVCSAKPGNWKRPLLVGSLGLATVLVATILVMTGLITLTRAQNQTQLQPAKVGEPDASKGVWAVRFAPVGDFAPRTPADFLDRIHRYASCRSGQEGEIGYFRTTKQGDRLAGSFLAYDPDQLKAALGKVPGLKVTSVEKLTQEQLVEYEKSEQESLDAQAQTSDSGQHTPPLIVKTVPEVGATDVDPDIKSITVTFDRDMGGGCSWTGGGPDFPGASDKKAFWRDKRTCELPVHLEKAHYYRVGINSKSFKNFRSAGGTPADPSAIYFTTQCASEELKIKVRPPHIVKLEPANGAKDVSVGLKEIRVTFDMEMGDGFSWCGEGPSYPEGREGEQAHWTDDHKTCVLMAALKPGKTYEIGLNCPCCNNFQSAAGVPLEPVNYTFTTEGAALPETADDQGEAYLAKRLEAAESGDYWAKYAVWACYQKGEHGVKPDDEKAAKWLGELTQNTWLAKFEPVNGFNPKDPGEFLNGITKYSHLFSSRRGLGLGSFFRTTRQDGKLIGSFLTDSPDGFTREFTKNPNLKLLSLEKVTPEQFIKHEKSEQESLDVPKQ